MLVDRDRSTSLWLGAYPPLHETLSLSAEENEGRATTSQTEQRLAGGAHSTALPTPPSVDLVAQYGGVHWETAAHACDFVARTGRVESRPNTVKGRKQIQYFVKAPPGCGNVRRPRNHTANKPRLEGRAHSYELPNFTKCGSGGEVREDTPEYYDTSLRSISGFGWVQ